MAEYQMQELTLPTENGEKRLYPRMCIRRMVDLEQLVAKMNRNSGFSSGQIVGLITELTEQIVLEMAEGNSVKIDGLGVFTPSLGLKEGVKPESGEKGCKKLNAASICLKDINFRADKGFIAETERHCTLTRSDKKCRRSSSQYTPEQRLELAQKFLTEHPFMKVGDYCRLTGLLPDAAARELRKWVETADSGITSTGQRTHKVYIRK